MTYKDQLKNTKWKLKRKEILQRDSYKCVTCDSEENLHVHHKEYHPGKLAWEYDNKHLVTLCESCHTEEHSKKSLSDFIKVPDEDYTLINIDANYYLEKPYIKYYSNILLPKESLCLIKGEVGSGKSTLLLNLVIGLLTNEDQIGLEYNVPESKILYFSTEMSKNTLQKRLITVNSIAKTKDRFLVYDISNALNMFNTITQLIEEHKPSIVIIDQLGDFVDDINDSSFTAILSKNLIKLINQYSISVITVIHQNQDNKLQGKARGHLGSLIEQKAFSSIAIGKKEDQFILKSTKIREGESFTMYLEYDTSLNLFKSNDKEPLKDFMKEPRSSEELKTFVQTVKKVGRNKALEIIKELEEKGTIKKENDSRKAKFIYNG